MRYVILALSALFLLHSSDGYKCNSGRCRTPDKCCNPLYRGGVCCPRRSTCCFHGPFNACCRPGEPCCWDKQRRGVRCCPRGFHCCSDRKRRTCCYKTPLFIWIIVGFCLSIIVLLLLLSMYQCFLEQREEYENQRLNGTIPPESSWYYYDYGTGNRYRPTPPAYTPPPNYTAPQPYSAPQPIPSNSNNRSRNNNNQAPKPPTPQPSTRSNSVPVEQIRHVVTSSVSERYDSAASHLGDEVSALSHDSSDLNESELSEPELAASLAARDPILSVMHTLYTHPVPRLQRMLCTKHNCMVDDGSCVFCMDQEEEDGSGVFLDDLVQSKGAVVISNPLNEQRIKSD